jgi:cysteinyl-tRNA synthetase
LEFDSSEIPIDDEKKKKRKNKKQKKTKMSSASSSSSSVEIPSHWRDPSVDNDSGVRTGLKLVNSLAGNAKVEFVPKRGKQVGWYICGPTVYDSAHLGHARNYMSFDIIRRVLEDYFNYDVFYVMNITDVDDKIINRSWLRRLEALALQFSQHLDATEALALRVDDTLKRARSADDKPTPEEMASICNDLHQNSGENENQDGADGWSMQTAYLELAQHYEAEFVEDMRLLGIRRPSVVTRVSEYVDDIKTFVQGIIDRGFAYAAEGNVYFDSTAFHDAGYGYGKTSGRPLDAAARQELLADGEGSAMATGGKKRDEDFALWKASKPGEPIWESPWGDGRPGWHIECSAMASDLLGDNMDLNCGGTDLRFPHHDNQLAQSEAHFGCHQWVNYFLHTGHLHIDGRKMSKSLKNFISIRNCLEHYSARHMRMLFLLSFWNSKMDVAMTGDEQSAGRLEVHSARIGASDDATEHVRSLIVGDHRLFVGVDHVFPVNGGAAASSSPSAASSSSSSPSSPLRLTIEYSLDGEKNARQWLLDSATCRLAREPVDLRAGRVDQLNGVIDLERIFADFFLNVGVVLRAANGDGVSRTEKWSVHDKALHASVLDTQERVHAALLDSINTPVAMSALQSLASATIAYLAAAAEDGRAPSATVLRSASSHVGRMLRVFGVIADDEATDDIEDSAGGFRWAPAHSSHLKRPLVDVLDTLLGFRDACRVAARGKADAAQFAQACDALQVPDADVEALPHIAARRALLSFAERIRAIAADADGGQLPAWRRVLAECDDVRNDVLPLLGVRVEDSTAAGRPSEWKLDDPLSTRRDREQRLCATFQREAIAARKAEERRAREAAALARALVPPADFFRVDAAHAGKYAEYNEQGIPTVMADGKPVAKKAHSRFTKFYQNHVRAHEKALAKQAEQQK